MIAEQSPLEAVLLEVTTTYILHSTVVLTGTWMLLRSLRPGNPRVVERLWKIAALAGLITAPVQIHVVGARPALTLPLPVDGTWRRVLNTPVARGSPGAPESSRSRLRGADSRDMRAGEDDAVSGLRLTGAPTRPAPAGEVAQAATEGRGVARVAESRPAARRGSQARAEQKAAEGWSAGVGLALGLFVLAGGLRAIGQSIHFRHQLGRCRVLRGGPGRQVLDELIRDTGLRRSVVLLASPRHAEPAAAGILTWRILLPEGADGALEREELRALVAHELAHLRRGDLLWLLVGRWLCTCCFIQPLNFLARREWRRAAEVICDEAAMEYGASSLSLARCLARVAEWKLDRPPCPAALGASGRDADLVQRVQRLLAPRDAAWAGRRLAPVVATVAAIGFWSCLVPWGPRTTAAVRTAASPDRAGAPSRPSAMNGEIESGSVGPERAAGAQDGLERERAVSVAARELHAEVEALRRELRELAESADSRYLDGRTQEALDRLRRHARALGEREMRLGEELAPHLAVERTGDSGVDFAGRE